jgi:putative inorganic carbon (HCO3(-)) transporter
MISTMTILIAILLIIFAIISFKRLNFGLSIIALLLPSYLVRFKIGFVPFTLLEGMILVLFLVWLTKKISNQKLRASLKEIFYKLRESKFFLPILFFLLASIISIFISPNKIAALGIWKAYFLEPIILLFIFIDVIKEKKEKDRILWSLGFSATIVSAIAIFQYFTGWNVPQNYWQDRRVTSVYGYPAALGLYVTPLLTIFLGMIIEKLKTQSSSWRTKLKFLAIVTICLVMGLALIFSQTQGAWVGIVAALFFMLIFTKYRRWMIFATIILVFLIFLIPQTRDYISPILTFKDVSGDVRLTLWQGTWKMIKANPIFGAGLSGFPVLYEQYKEAKHVEFLPYPHNIIFNFWVEIGLVGLIAFIWLVINFFRQGFKTNLKLKTQGPWLKAHGSELVIPLLASMISILIYGLVDVPYFKNDLSYLFWILISLMICSFNKNQKS